MCVEDINMYAKEHQAINLLPAPAAAAGTMILYIFTLRRVYVCVGGYNTCAQDVCMCAKEGQATGLLPAPAAAVGTMCLYICILLCVYVCVGGYNMCAADMNMCELQPVAFGVSFNLNPQSQSHWSLFNGTWQKRPRELDHRWRFEN